MGRYPIGKHAMTDAERKRRQRERSRKATPPHGPQAKPQVSTSRDAAQVADPAPEIAALKTENANLRAELESRKGDDFADAITRRVNAEMPKYQQAFAEAQAISKYHEGYIENWMYPQILARFHPNYSGYKGKKDDEIFNALKGLEAVLRKKAVPPLPPDIPKTRAEWDALKRQVKRERAAKRRANKEVKTRKAIR